MAVALQLWRSPRDGSVTVAATAERQATDVGPSYIDNVCVVNTVVPEIKK